jgi:hypothetical protein
MSSASRPQGSDTHDAWQRHYERTLSKRRRVRRVKRVRRSAAKRLLYRHRRLLGLVVAIAALYVAALAAAFIL